MRQNKEIDIPTQDNRILKPTYCIYSDKYFDEESNQLFWSDTEEWVSYLDSTEFTLKEKIYKKSVLIKSVVHII